MSSPPRQKRAYCKRGTGATARKKNAATPGGETPSTTKKPAGRTTERTLLRSARRIFEQAAPDYRAALLAARRAGQMLCDANVADDEGRTRLRLALNVLLLTTSGDDVAFVASDAHPVELDGLARVLKICLGPHAVSDSPDVWEWPAGAQVGDAAQRCASPLCLAALTIVRNLANVPLNKSRVANHPRLFAAVLAFLEPRLLGLQSAALAIETISAVSRYVEVGGNFVEPHWSAFNSSRTLDGTNDKRRDDYGLASLMPAAHREYRALGGYSDDECVIKFKLAQATLRAIRGALAYAASPQPDGFSLLDANDASRLRRWVVERDTVDGASAGAGGPRAAPARTLAWHRRTLALRALDALSSLRVTEANARALARTPGDVVDRCVERLQMDAGGHVDSELRLMALESLLLLTDVPVAHADYGAAGHAALRVAGNSAALDVVVATLVATHLRFMVQAAPVPPASAPGLPPAPALASPDAAQDHAAMPVAPTDAAVPAAPAPAGVARSEASLVLAPPRAQRAETVRVAVALLANMAALDAGALSRLRGLRPLLYAAASADDAVADLVFNKLGGP
ncbi:hypothetical protein M885DRAFT_567248 [Pelagophyceae sp. CCMP2097]|nr:hypothetical protein M885DRAFT_567248 [Pelagophyceae sp. CCMP2097]